MKSMRKRAFILNDCKSQYIQQAIFILKEGVEEESSKVIADAERIVASYMGRGIVKNGKKEKNKNGMVAAVLFILAIISAIVIAYFI